MSKRGAPKGGRVHWLLHRLSFDFRHKYYRSYDYLKHSYFFLRNYDGFSMKHLRMSDVFIVTRTSKLCWRVSSCNIPFGLCEYASLRDSQAVADYLDMKSSEYEQQRILWEKEQAAQMLAKKSKK